MRNDDFLELHVDEKPDPILVRVADSRRRTFVVPVTVPSTSFVGRLFGRTKTKLETHEYTSDEFPRGAGETQFVAGPIAIGPGEVWMNADPTPGVRVCSYCDRVKPADRLQCEGCGAAK